MKNSSIPSFTTISRDQLNNFAIVVGSGIYCSGIHILFSDGTCIYARKEELESFKEKHNYNPNFFKEKKK